VRKSGSAGGQTLCTAGGTRGTAPVLAAGTNLPRKDSSGRRSHLDADDKGTAASGPDATGVGDSVLQEAGAIRECEEHGWMQDRADPHARDRAFDIARQNPPPGLSPQAAAVDIAEVLDSIGDTCPECRETRSASNPATNQRV
jgi:hypothetical protein